MGMLIHYKTSEMHFWRLLAFSRKHEMCQSALLYADVHSSVFITL